MRLFRPLLIHLPAYRIALERKNGMKLNETEVSNHLQSLLGQDRDGFQQAWVDILEADPQTLEEITPIVRKIRNGAIKQYFHKKHRSAVTGSITIP